MILIDGKAVAKKIRENLKLEVDELKKRNIIPKLAVIMVGDNSASKIYVKNKSKACQETGIEYEEYLLNERTSQEDLEKLIDNLNKNNNIHGILLQSPIPKNLDINEAFKLINEDKDVDGFNPINVGKLVIGNDTFISCTPYGIIRLLKEYDIEIEGKNAVIIGRSNIVGKPLLHCLLSENATVTIAHSKTVNLKEISRNADILISAIGKPKFITKDMVKKDAIVIDVGINRLEDGKIVGDVDFR